MSNQEQRYHRETEKHFIIEEHLTEEETEEFYKFEEKERKEKTIQYQREDRFHKLNMKLTGNLWPKEFKENPEEDLKIKENLPEGEFQLYKKWEKKERKAFEKRLARDEAEEEEEREYEERYSDQFPYKEVLRNRKRKQQVQQLEQDEEDIYKSRSAYKAREPYIYEEELERKKEIEDIQIKQEKADKEEKDRKEKRNKQIEEKRQSDEKDEEEEENMRYRQPPEQEKEGEIQKKTKTPRPKPGDNWEKDQKAIQRVLWSQESISVSCSYCSIQHEGPHCYEGTCDLVLSVIPPPERPGKQKQRTKQICTECFGRHGEPWNDPYFYGRRVDCRRCQKTHDAPFCTPGSCIVAWKVPFICTLLHHPKVKCTNPNCHFNTKAPSERAYPTLQICNECGARHRNYLAILEPPQVVDCEFCHTVHKHPFCMQGNCEIATLVKTPHLDDNGRPLKPPHPNFICNSCGRRHILPKYGDHRGGAPRAIPFSGFKQICPVCQEDHGFPHCTLMAKCGQQPLPVRPGKIKTRFLCFCCGKRHLQKQQPLSGKATKTMEFALSYNHLNEIECHWCDHRHKYPRCVPTQPDECPAKIKLDLPFTNTPYLLCPLCDVRHLNAQILAQEPKIEKCTDNDYQKEEEEGLTERNSTQNDKKEKEKTKQQNQNQTLQPGICETQPKKEENNPPQYFNQFGSRRFAMPFYNGAMRQNTYKPRFNNRRMQTNDDCPNHYSLLNKKEGLQTQNPCPFGLNLENSNKQTEERSEVPLFRQPPPLPSYIQTSLPSVQFCRECLCLHDEPSCLISENQYEFCTFCSGFHHLPACRAGQCSTDLNEEDWKDRRRRHFCVLCLERHVPPYATVNANVLISRIPDFAITFDKYRAVRATRTPSGLTTVARNAHLKLVTTGPVREEENATEETNKEDSEETKLKDKFTLFSVTLPSSGQISEIKNLLWVLTVVLFAALIHYFTK